METGVTLFLEDKFPMGPRVASVVAHIWYHAVSYNYGQELHQWLLIFGTMQTHTIISVLSILNSSGATEKVATLV